jgi:hypothetical protein
LMDILEVNELIECDKREWVPLAIDLTPDNPGNNPSIKWKPGDSPHFRLQRATY